MDVRAGIFWDPREPPPPGIEAAVDMAHHFGGHHNHGYRGGVRVPAVHAYHENRFYRQPPHQPQPQPGGPRGDWDEVAVPIPQRNNLPPLSVSLTAHVVQDTAKVTVTQLFWNNTNESIWKGAYTFPLYTGCTVTSFSCRIGRNKIVKAKVESKPEARDAFHEALRTDRSAGLLEQDTPEIFTTTLGNIPANTKLRTEITYVTLLKHRFADNCSTTTLTIPTNIAPRYGSPPPELQSTPIAGLSHGISIQVDVVAEEVAHQICSKSHKITIERGIGRNLYDNWTEFATTDGTNDVEVSLVKLEDGTAFLDKDFVLDITRETQNGLETPTAWLETHPSLANHKAVMLTIPPQFTLRNQSSHPGGEIIFLADRSGSMLDKMQSLKSAMNFFLKGIPQGRKFNIWCFGTGYTSLWPRAVDYSERALQEAMNYVSGQFSSNMGGTELLGALKAIIGERNQGLHMIDIVMLTDGEVWGLDKTISFVQDTSRSSEGRIRYFALGIGNAVSHELVEGIAKAGGGYAEVIPAASHGGWEDRVVAMLSAALAGHVGPFQIEFDGQGEDHARGIHLQDRNRDQAATSPARPDILQSPADISTLSPFLRNRVFMLFDSAREHLPLNHININATAPGGEEIIARVPISLLERKDSTLHKLGARALLGDLERGQSWIHLDSNAPSRGSTEEQKLVRQEGETLGCKWSLVSKWTSFYAVEEPYQAAERTRIPFLDADDIHIHEAVGDLDLLRPRGVAAQQENLPTVHLPAALAAVEAGDGSDDDEDAASNSDCTDMRSVGNGSDSDDGANNGDGGAGGNRVGGGARDQQGSELGDRNADGDEDGNGGNNGGGGEGAGGNRAGSGAGDQQRPELGDQHASGDRGATGGNSDTQNDGTLPSRLSNHNLTSSSLGSRSAISSLRDAESSVRRVAFSSSPLYQTTHQYDLTTNSFRRSLGYSDHRSQSNYFDIANTINWASTSPVADIPAAAAVSARRHASSRRHASFDPTTTSYGGSHQSSPIYEYVTQHHTPVQINTPSFNMPASTAMRPNESRTPKSAQEIAGEHKIRSLLVFQSFDGSFNFDSVEQLRIHLGLGFASVVQDLQAQAEFKLAVTVGLMLLLEEKFEHCRDLWTLVYNKATNYIKSQRPLELERNLLLGSARLKVHALDISQILQPAPPAQPVVSPLARRHILNSRSWEESGAAVGNEGSAKRVILDTAPIKE